MSPIIIKGIQLLLSLSLLVVLHELGHFIPAKLFKTRVEKFYLFFDVKFALFKKKFGGTEYGIGWLPLGGYVKISGMIDESMDTEQMKLPPEPWEFRSKPAWQRLIIMLGGVIVNLILGFMIYMMILFVWGKDTLTTEAIPNGMEVSELAQKVGFLNGDKILSVDGQVLDNVLMINKDLFLRSVQEVDVMRADGTKKTLQIPEDFGSQMFESGDLRPFTIPTTTGKKERYIEIIAFGNKPVTPTEFITTIIIGAIARIGMVWLAITQGITLRSIVLLWTMPKASKIPKSVPRKNPAKVACKVIQPW